MRYVHRSPHQRRSLECQYLSRSYRTNEFAAYSPHWLFAFDRFVATPLKVDLLVLYTPEAMADIFITSSSAMETLIKTYFAEANLGNDNSEILLEYNVVHVTEVRVSNPN